jgi:glycosyltransferase involved in cell wall biosynthesis
MGQEQCLSDIDGFTAAIEKLYLDRKTRRAMGAAGVEHARTFSWDRTTDVIESELNKALETPAISAAPAA